MKIARESGKIASSSGSTISGARRQSQMTAIACLSLLMSLATGLLVPSSPKAYPLLRPSQNTLAVAAVWQLAVLLHPFACILVTAAAATAAITLILVITLTIAQN
jgi:hypothetical protein